jgi:hypothetical protein
MSDFVPKMSVGQKIPFAINFALCSAGMILLHNFGRNHGPPYFHGLNPNSWFTIIKYVLQIPGWSSSDWRMEKYRIWIRGRKQLPDANPGGGGRKNISAMRAAGSIHFAGPAHAVS